MANLKSKLPPIGVALGWAGLVALTLALVVVPFLLFGPALEAWSLLVIETSSAGLLALLAAGILASDILLPVPSSLVSLATGAALGPWIGGLAIWLGMSLGCAVGWAAGRGLLGPVSRRLVPGEGEVSYWSLTLLRPVPVLAEMSVLIAGARGVRFAPMMAVCALANMPVAAFYGYFGAYLLGEVPLPYLLGALGGLFAVMLVVSHSKAAGT